MNNLREVLVEKTATIGEKLSIRRFAKVTGECVASYIHAGGKIGVLVAAEGATGVEEALTNVAMQVAAMNPIAVKRDEVPANIIATELEVGREKARQEGKPEAMLDKIAEGRLNKFYKESTLLEQDFIKDAKVSVQQYLKQVSASLTATAFKRVTLNEE